jgi:transcriptional regulator with XRE-family HTH domain
VSAAAAAAPPPATAQEFGEVLRAIRESYGYSEKALAKLVGRNANDIRAWEEGARRPVGRDLPRLFSVMKRLRPYARLLPKMPTFHGGSDDIVLAEIISEAEPMPDELPKPKPLYPTFHEGLRAERDKEKLTTRALGELVGFSAATITALEGGAPRINPALHAKLVEIFPALATVPAPPFMDPKDLARAQARLATQASAAKPTERPRLSVQEIRAALRVEPGEKPESSGILEDRIHVETGVGRPAASVKVPAEPPPLATLAARVSLAMVRAEVARGRLREAEAEVGDAEKEATNAMQEWQDSVKRSAAAELGKR